MQTPWDAPQTDDNPYRAPQIEIVDKLRDDSTPHPSEALGDYRPAVGLVMFVTLAAVIYGLISAVVGYIVLEEWLIAGDAQRGGATPNDLVRWDTLAGVAELLSIPSVIAGLVFLISYLAFVRRSNVNTKALGARPMDYGPVGAIGWHFVPIVGWILPFKVIGEIWRGSNPQEVPTLRYGWKNRSTPGFILVWWLLWVADGIFGRFLIRQKIDENTALEELISHLQTSMVYCALTIVVAGLTVYVVRAMHARLEHRHAAMCGWEAGQGNEMVPGADGSGPDFSRRSDFGPAWRIR